MAQSVKKRESWGSKLGFILATSGAAVGLGNIQRFPYITADNGGAAFVFIYILCVLAIGLPLMLVEFSIGRATQSNPVAAIQKIRPGSSWRLAGLLGVFTAFFILTYYLVAAGWTVAYVLQMLRSDVRPLSEFASDPLSVFPYIIFMLGTVILIVLRGLRKGIEKVSKAVMPLLVVLLLILVVRSLTLENSWEGVRFYLYPDLSEITPRVFLYALSQAFFSLCVGEAVLVTYGSYVSKDDNIVASAGYIALFDTLIAVISGLIIFPALFAFNEPVGQGVGLIYNIMPKIFLEMPLGWLLGALFFLVLSFAALTTCIALLEIPVVFLMETAKWSRNRSTWFLGGLALLFSVPSALSVGAHKGLTELHFSFLDQTGFYELMDFVWGNLSMVIGGLGLCLFTAHVWGAEKALKELQSGCPELGILGKAWIYIVKYFAPVSIICILLGLFTS